MLEVLYIKFHENLTKDFEHIHKSLYMPSSKVVLKMNQSKPKSEQPHNISTSLPY